MKTLLLTGGTGYIGSHCAVLLAQNSYNIVIIDNLSNSAQDVIGKIEQLSGKKVSFYHGDIRDKEILKKIFSENSIDTVLHFAGAKSVGESCEKPFEYYENNVVGTLQLTEVMNDFGVKDMIFSSSATVYDPLSTPPFTEDTPLGNTTNPYGTTKFLIENILRDLANHKGFKVGNLRYFNPIGAHESGLIGENPHDIPNNLLPFIMKVASEELTELSIFGNDYNTSDGTGVRDYIHVIDLAEGHIAALTWLKQQGSNIFENFNLGTGNGTSVLEMVSYTETIIGKSVPYKIIERRSGDIASAYCSPKKAEEIFKWKAQKTVKQAIKDSWNFIQNTQGK